MNNDTNEIKQLNDKVVKLEVKLDYIEKQHNKIETDFKDLKKDIDTRFDEFEKMLKGQFLSITSSLKDLENIITEGRGAKKMFNIIVSIIVGGAGVFTFIYPFFK
jgi:SMC interacting uncharacterized protein involved in chromosome segregation